MNTPALFKPRVLTLQTSGYWFIGFLIATLAAFWPSYLSKLPARMDVYTHVHAALMTVWCGLLIAQPFLIRGDRRAWHRRLGRVSYVLMPVLVASWMLLIHVRAAAMGDEQFAAEGHAFYVPLAAAIQFVGAWTMAMLRRRTPPLHARYMVCTGVSAIDALVARLIFFNLPPLPHLLLYQAIGFTIADGILLTLYVVDRSPYRRAFLHMLLFFLPVHLFFFTGVQTSAWLDVVRWFRSLPLT